MTDHDSGDRLDEEIRAGFRQLSGVDVAIERPGAGGVDDDSEFGPGPDCPLAVLLLGWELTDEERRHVDSCLFCTRQRVVERNRRRIAPAVGWLRAVAGGPSALDFVDGHGNRLDLDLPGTARGRLFVKDSRGGETFRLTISVDGRERAAALVTVGESGWGEFQLDGPLAPAPGGGPEVAWQLDRIDPYSGR